MNTATTSPQFRMMSLVREAFRASSSQMVGTVITIVIVAGMCASVILTTGRTVGAEDKVLATLDSAGTRSIIVLADADSGLDTSVLTRLSNIDGISWAGAFGAAEDATNAAIPGGTKVPVRLAWSSNFEPLGIPQDAVNNGQTGWASKAALAQLGMSANVGGAISETGSDFAIAGKLIPPDYLNFLEPLVVVPQPAATTAAPVSVLVVIAARPDLVAPVSAALKSVLAIDDPNKAKVTTSESLAALRAIVQGQLGSFGRYLVALIFAISAILVGAILFGMVMLRRKDFGRRRALGASRGLIVELILIQTAGLSAAGALLGSAIAATALGISGDPLPSLQFFLAVGSLAVFVSALAALIPAVVASRRDPLKELRVP